LRACEISTRGNGGGFPDQVALTEQDHQVTVTRPDMVIDADHIMTPKRVTHIMFLTVPTQCRYLLLLYRGLHSQSRMHPMTCAPNTSSVRVFGCQALFHPYLNHPRRARMYVTHERQHCHKTSHSEVSITHEKKCQPQGASVLESDSTVAPTPATPLSEREAGLTESDSPALPSSSYSGYAPVVNGDDTLSCSSPPNFSDMNITHEKKCQPQGGTELERRYSYFYHSSVLCFSDDYTGQNMSSSRWS
jgi:hypothetical protein